MNSKIILASTLLAGVIFTDAILSQEHAAIFNQPHLEVSVEEPVLLYVCSPAASGNTHTTVNATETMSFSDYPHI